MDNSPEPTHFIDPERLIQSDLWMAQPDHPIITGKCPRCQYEFLKTEALIHYDCPKCGWMDDSI
jgi:hypothetical protein